MAEILLATVSGCRVFTSSGEGEPELVVRQVSALAPEIGGACLAVVDGKEVWRRTAAGARSKVTMADICLQSITAIDGTIFCGAMDEAVMMRVSVKGEPERLKGFDIVPGRSEWFAGCPPLGVRSLAATIDGAAILAAVHVGGIPRSEDRGETWTPTVPIMFDIHEVRSHPSFPNVIAAAAAVGLCVSHDGGRATFSRISFRTRPNLERRRSWSRQTKEHWHNAFQKAKSPFQNDVSRSRNAQKSRNRLHNSYTAKNQPLISL